VLGERLPRLLERRDDLELAMRAPLHDALVYSGPGRQGADGSMVR
jgi:hypothetical protein